MASAGGRGAFGVPCPVGVGWAVEKIEELARRRPFRFFFGTVTSIGTILDGAGPVDPAKIGGSGNRRVGCCPEEESACELEVF